MHFIDHHVLLSSCAVILSNDHVFSMLRYVNVASKCAQEPLLYVAISLNCSISPLHYTISPLYYFIITLYYFTITLYYFTIILLHHYIILFHHYIILSHHYTISSLHYTISSLYYFTFATNNFGGKRTFSNNQDGGMSHEYHPRQPGKLLKETHSHS